MHTDHSEETGWTFWCVWGCFDYGYTSQEAAEQGFLHHTCTKGS